MIRAIAFDLFDTLVDQNRDRIPRVEVEGRRLSPSALVLHETLLQSLDLELSLSDYAALQAEIDRALYRETLANGVELPTDRRFEALLDELGQPTNVALVEALTAAHMGILKAAVSVPDHHEAVLASLAIEYPLALCSNFSHSETARGLLEDANLSPHFQACVISDEVGIRKPRPEIFEEVAKRLDVPPNEILHVGDNLEADVGGAAAAGMRTVWLTRCIEDPERSLNEFQGPRPDFALEDLMDLPVLAARLTAGQKTRS